MRLFTTGRTAVCPRSNILLSSWLIGITLLLLAQTSPAQRQNHAVSSQDDGRCHCMEYWECVTSGGKPISYCGPAENQVCCFLPKNAKPVGILPRRSGKRSVCGRKGGPTDGGEDGTAEVAEWPWQAAILEKSQDLYVCGASLLDEKWILTAAHCVYTYIGSQTSLKVRLGEYNVSGTNEHYKYEEMEVDHIVLHPGFINTTLLNDIALLRLAQKAEKRPNIDIVCMPTADDDKVTSSRRCVVTGWGRVSETSDHSTTLKEIPVPLWKNKDCQTALQNQFGSNFALPHTAMCAGAEDKDACDGDGGSPLVCERNGHWEQVGLVSYGIGCGRPNLPGVYTRVLAYLHWIKQSIRLNS